MTWYILDINVRKLGVFCHVEGGDEKSDACVNIESIFKNIEIMFVCLGISNHVSPCTTTKSIKEK